MNLRIIRLTDGEDCYYDEYFIVRAENFERAKELCEEAKEQYYEDDYSISLWEIYLELLRKNNIEFVNYSYCDVDYEF